MNPLHVSAILFDLDGTLVDSTASVERSWRTTAAAIGVPFAEIEPFIHGIPARQVLARVAPDLDPARWAEIATQMLIREAEDTEDIVPAPGAARLLDGLPTTRWAIVTSGDQRLATSRLRAAGLPSPRVLISADDVAIGKPDPTGYLAAASALGAEPARCLVVEDAPAGVQAGRAAGMPVLGLRTTNPELAGADWLVGDLGQVRMEVDRLGVQVWLGAVAVGSSE